ncbi:MAG: hypothetical protein LBR70_03710 [Lactobacillaceae bacterium]|jgi:hypothetical protein|nr:hypothetical protein [Lactobacillaceae bacterium]
MVFFLALCLMVVFTANAFANPACAVCTVAVGASLEIARQLGVDDCVVGVWSGAFLALLGFWLIKWFDKKNWHFWGRDFVSIWGSVAMIGFMYVSRIPYNPTPILIFYMDPFLFSVILGALVLIYSSEFYQWMKAKNGGHAHFPFEKVLVPVAALAIVSAVFYFYPLAQRANDVFAI